MSIPKRSFALAVVMLLCALTPVSLGEELVSTIVSTGTTQAFAEEAVSEDDLTSILEAGLSATSAINQQPWFFAVVTNEAVMEEISGSMSFGAAPAGMPEGAPAGGELPQGAETPVTPPSMPAVNAGGAAKAALGDSPVAIIIYMDESTASPNASFDCGLACQNMVIAASALGYGTKIVSSPTMALNGDNHDALCETLGVDPALQAVAVLLLGKPSGETDAVASASVRNTIEEKVSFVK